MVNTRLYRNGVLRAEGFPIADVSEHIGDPETVVWFDLCYPDEENLRVISEELGLHELAVEDVLADHQRPKLDTYDSHLFLTVYGVRLAEGALDLTEISIFVTKNALVTVRENENFGIEQVVGRWDANKEMARFGVSFLLHGVLDAVVDGHFEVVGRLDDEIEKLEDKLFDESSDRRELQLSTFAVRKNMVTFRKVTLPMREVVNSLFKRDLGVIQPVMVPYYQDVYDHVLRVAEWTDSLRELVGNIRETHLTLQGYRLNDIMKRVTSWAAIIAVPTLITGFYGQNVPYPGAERPLGFWTSTLLILCGTFLLYKIFKRRDWL
ncbi:magnesium transporter CorA [Microtetraspora sp. NBRC 13810]|uniref:magnesium transporter CorA family protein n=1 Tax=Microtetraspora sp. NBRC 13810 TaxID=3030990 RepID=UPI0024A0D37C|nr:magnesium transporter CorA family protein [Microtetraspora sp. NBRC 13810]GLW05669.1 magnesium transporter CorA [Microtetraspora sp. NBRC 13810]